MLNAATLDFIRDHVNDDVRQLALGRVPDDVNLREALTQIEGRQLSVRKLPACAATDGFRFPPRLSLEQCSSEATAAYKRTIVARLISTLPPEEAKEEGLSFIDLTGGLGIDFMAIAPLFRRAVYVERNPELCDLARHNLPLMGCPHAEVLCLEVTSGDSSCFPQHFSCCFIDPARRDAAGRKVALIEDCTPDVCAMQDQLRAHAQFTLIKLSPMLDLTAALRVIKGITEAHVVCVDGECKELLLVMSSLSTADEPMIHCTNLPNGTPFSFRISEEAMTIPQFAAQLGDYVYEPHAGILKAGAFKTICQRFPVQKLSSAAHLYTANQLLRDFPGRVWHIEDSSTFNKKELKRLLAGIDAAELTVRGFPMSVAMLRKQLHLRDGGSVHFIATTLADNTKILLKVSPPNSKL